MQSSHSYSDPQACILLYQLTSASFALSDALAREDRRDQQVEEACHALEVFELLERGPTTFNVPRDVRDKVRASIDALREGHLELAHTSLSRAGGEFQRHLIQADLPRRWSH